LDVKPCSIPIRDRVCTALSAKTLLALSLLFDVVADVFSRWYRYVRCYFCHVFAGGSRKVHSSADRITEVS